MNDDEISYEHIQEAMQEASQAAFERLPIDSDWGFCAYGDAPGAIGGGMQAFYWFEAREEMLSFLAKYGLFMNPPRCDLDLNSLQADVDRAVGLLRTPALEDTAGINALNECLRHASQLTWIGNFSSLRQGESEFAIKIRAEFRDESDGELDGSVSDDELDEFHQFLHDYCI